MPKEWIVTPDRPEAESLARSAGLSRLAAQILLNRGVNDVENARRFIRPPFVDLFPPESIFGMTDAVAIIRDAMKAQQRIVIYGDYDVDGITATAILWHCLKIAGAAVEYYVPHRLEEGYGLNSEAIEKLAADGADLIITVDCGITAVEQADVARRAGIKLIITDHHTPSHGPDGAITLPNADAVVHPGLGDTPLNPDLSGAGVALKLAWAIAQELSESSRVSPEFREFLLNATALAALGLIADIVPLTGENRIITLHGLRALPGSQLHGIRALIESAGLDGAKLDGYDVGFKLAPRINAIGRMGHAQLAVEMLTRASPEEAHAIAKNLEQQNRKRQALERRIRGEAMAMVEEQGLAGDNSRAIVVASTEWHPGVVGIVASRLVDEYRRPAVVLCIDKEGMAQGSARSISAFPLYEALSQCSEYLTKYGGHAMAAGMTLKADRIDEFTKAFYRCAEQRVTAADLLPKLRIDAFARLDELTESLMAELSQLEPHGMGNAAPRFATEWVSLADDPRVVGKNGDHLQLVVSENGTRRKGIAFGMGKYFDALSDVRKCRLAFEPIINEWNGRRTVEMRILDFQLPQ